MPTVRVYADSPKPGDYEDRKAYKAAYSKWYYTNVIKGDREKLDTHASVKKRKHKMTVEERNESRERIAVAKVKAHTALVEEEIAESVEYLDYVPEECSTEPTEYLLDGKILLD